MPIFLILKRTGSKPDDLDVIAVIDKPKSKEAEQALSDIVDEPGDYIAVPFDEEKIVQKRARHKIELVDDPGPDPIAKPVVSVDPESEIPIER